MRAKVFEDLVPVVLKQCALLAEKEIPQYDKVMDEVTHKAKIMDMKNRLKQPEVEPREVKTEEPKLRMTTEDSDDFMGEDF